MTDIREFRARLVTQPERKPPLLPTIVVSIVAFVASGSLVLFWDTVSSPSQWLPSFATSGEPAPSFTGVRLGRPETAPILNLCFTADRILGGPNEMYTPELLFRALTAADTAFTVSSAFGNPEGKPVELATQWGGIADCVLRQNTMQLCDIDNRSLALHASKIFLRQADAISAEPARYKAMAGELQTLSGLKDRVLGHLQNRIQRGVLIARDFPTVMPAPMRKVMNETKPLENACEKH